MNISIVIEGGKLCDAAFLNASLFYTILWKLLLVLNVTVLFEKYLISSSTVQWNNSGFCDLAV